MIPCRSTRLAIVLLLCIGGTSRSAVIGVDGVHGFSPETYLATGSSFGAFRSLIQAAGHTIVPLSSFETADLAGLDGLIVKMPYETAFSTSEIVGIQAFTRRAVFMSDSSIFSDPGSRVDRPITFGENSRLLENIMAFITGVPGTLFLADAGLGRNTSNMNALVAPYGISYDGDGIDPDGRTITALAGHPVTQGVSAIGIDFQLSMTVAVPSIALTTSSVASDRVLAVYEVPEPACQSMVGIGATIFVGRRRHSE